MTCIVIYQSNSNWATASPLLHPKSPINTIICF